MMNRYRGTRLLITATVLFILPATANSQQLMSVIKSHSNLSSFANAIESNGLDKKLAEKGPFTVFAPTNADFDKEVSGKSLSSSSVRSMVLNHIMTGYATERNMKMMSRATSLGGITLDMKAYGDQVKINNNAEIIKGNIKAQNGVLHIIKGVLK